MLMCWHCILIYKYLIFLFKVTISKGHNSGKNNRTYLKLNQFHYIPKAEDNKREQSDRFG